MKRTNLVLERDNLEELVKVCGVKTYSEAVNLAISEMIRKKKVKNLKNFIGSGIWQGDLSAMREDRKTYKKK